MRDRLRRTMMFIPGNNPSMLIDAYIYKPDSIMMDLEDAVSINQKDAARMLVHNALKNVDYGDIETVVRINSLDSEHGIEDVRAVISAGVDVIRLPKTDDAEDVILADKIITEVEKEFGVEKETLLMAAIESATGVLNAVEIAKASKRLIGIAIGAEDYLTDLNTHKSAHGMELFLARAQIVLAAKSAGISCFDTVNSNLDDMDQFRREVEFIKDLGFNGKSVIHPKQIEIVNEIYTPSKDQVEKSIRIIMEMKRALDEGIGVMSIDGKMVDKPVITRAENVIKLAVQSGILEKGEIDGF